MRDISELIEKEKQKEVENTSSKNLSDKLNREIKEEDLKLINTFHRKKHRSWPKGIG